MSTRRAPGIKVHVVAMAIRGVEVAEDLHGATTSPNNGTLEHQGEKWYFAIRARANASQPRPGQGLPKLQRTLGSHVCAKAGAGESPTATMARTASARRMPRIFTNLFLLDSPSTNLQPPEKKRAHGNCPSDGLDFRSPIHRMLAWTAFPLPSCVAFVRYLLHPLQVSRRHWKTTACSSFGVAA
jgi:hypothetical protein